MEEYDKLELARLECFKKCQAEEIDPNIDHEERKLQQNFFYAVTYTVYCVRRCEKELMGLIHIGGIPSHVLDQLKRKEGYNYLQMCLYNVRQK